MTLRYDVLINELEVASAVGLGPGPAKWPSQGASPTGGPVEYVNRDFDSFDTVNIKIPKATAKKLYILLSKIDFKL